MDGDRYEYPRPPACEICGSTEHTGDQHGYPAPGGQPGHGGQTGVPPTGVPPDFATEEIVVEDDDPGEASARSK